MPLNPAHMLTPQAAEFTRFPSRRSVVHSTKGIVSCTQPLAAKCGLEVLHAGGNAADAAVAVAAGLNMTEPCSTGIGGDMFILYYDAKTAKVSAMNGSGRSGNKCTLETALQNEGTIPKWKPEDHNTAPYLHAIIEALRLGFTDAQWYVTDPNVEKVPAAGLIAPEYLAARAKLFDATKAAASVERGTPPTIPSPALHSSDTVYFAVSDADGNAASFINSNYDGFGTGIIPRGCGFTLQNRGSNFSLDAGHPNRLAPRKRPYHTIIPGMVTNLADGSLHSAFGVMGGFMQPQGHVQVLLGQLVGGLNPQQALDAPRVCIDFDWNVNVEEGMPADTIEGLRKLGHKVRVLTGNERGLFGRGQIIRHTVDPLEDTGIWSAGSDMRGDGASYPAW
ncbi:hypothetical protein BN1708_008025 [Verticillium longisporum]|uniref:Gamma-glutamyltransferase n=1 Tax=Verticillium longisporum TaxID=100787 RepID=A0A0G4N0C3_VERLO|nr:hypothetical protein BN1708_008025 [Verticillium longisporum]